MKNPHIVMLVHHQTGSVEHYGPIPEDHVKVAMANLLKGRNAQAVAFPLFEYRGWGANANQQNNSLPPKPNGGVRHIPIRSPALEALRRI